jgi:hypothetical protein
VRRIQGPGSLPHKCRSRIASDRARWDARARNSSSPGRSRDRADSARSSGVGAVVHNRRAPRQAGRTEEAEQAEQGKVRGRAERTELPQGNPAARRGRAHIAVGLPAWPCPPRGCRSRCRSGRPAGASRRSWSRRPSRRRAYQVPRQTGHFPRFGASRLEIQTSPKRRELGLGRRGDYSVLAVSRGVPNWPVEENSALGGIQRELLAFRHGISLDRHLVSWRQLPLGFLSVAKTDC